MCLRRILAVSALLVSFLAAPKPAGAYSLLTHEQLIDLTWQSSIVPLLKSRYPTITQAQLEHARAFAYGGCVIQDIGYYPLGDRLFSDLTHYVRTGDFVVNLFRNAGSPDELAFAIGALSHYIGDTYGHSEATNLSVPVEFPQLGRKYGPSVSYADAERPHVQTEFAFDINEIAHHRLAPVHYLRHIGLGVSTRQISLAFYQTYGLREDFSGHRAARVNTGAYSFAVRRFIPRIAYALTVLHGRKEPAELPSAELQRLDDQVKRISAENDWDAYRKKPGIGTYSLAGLLFVLPKIGPLKLAALKGPTSDTEARYIHSVLTSSDALTHALRRFTPPPAVKATAAVAAQGSTADTPPPVSLKARAPAEILDPLHPLVNRDLDTGRASRPATYRLTDATYATLLHRLALTPTAPIPPGIKSDLETYYKDMTLAFDTKRKPAAWAAVQADLVTLKTIPTSTELNPFPTFDEDEPAAPVPDKTSIGTHP